MRVKIGDVWYSDDDGPIGFEFAEADKHYLFNQFATNKTKDRFAVFPPGWGTEDEMKAWIEAGENENCA